MQSSSKELLDFNQFILAQSIEECLAQAGLMIERLFLELGEILRISLASVEGSNTIASSRIDVALSSITSKKSEIKQHFLSDISSRLNFIAYLDPEDKPISRDTRRQTKDNGITQRVEVELAATKLASDITSSLSSLIQKVNQHYSFLRGMTYATYWSNLFKPELFVFGIVNAFEVSQIDPDSVDILIHGASKCLTFEVHVVYRHLVDFAESNNIGLVPQETHTKEAVEYADHAKSITDKINQMLQEERLRDPVDQALPKPEEVRIKTSELVGFAQAISPDDVSETKFMAALDQSFPGVKLTSLRKLLVDGGRHPNSDPSQRAFIAGKITGLLVDLICSDSRLLGPVRSEIAKLKQELQDIAKGDPTFITNHAHPMRLFVELVCHKSLAYKSEIDADFASFITPLRRAISSITRHKTTSSLKLVQAWLEKKWATTATSDSANQSNIFEQSKNRNLQAYQIRKEVSRHYNHHSKYPEFICTFVDGPWCNLLAHIELCDEPCKFTREMAFKTLKNLLWSVDIKAINGDVATFCKLSTKLLDEIKAGMQILGVTSDDIELSLFLTQLKKHSANILININRSSKSIPLIDFRTSSTFAKRAPNDTDVWLTPEEKRLIGHIQDERLADQATTDFMNTCLMAADVEEVPRSRKIIENPSDLPLNAWLEVKTTDDTWQRMLLQWKGDGLFMFIKASGESVSMTARQFGNLNRDYKIAVLIDRGIMSEALERLLSNHTYV